MKRGETVFFCSGGLGGIRILRCENDCIFFRLVVESSHHFGKGGVQMMVSVETVLLRGKRRMERLLDVPGLRQLGTGAGYLGFGVLLSAVQVWGRMQPAALGLIYASRGWRCCCAAVGCALGYRLLWGSEGWYGAAWAAGAGILVLGIRHWGGRRPWRMALGSAALTSAVGLVLYLREGTAPVLLVLRAAIAAGVGLLDSSQGRSLRWLGFGAGAMALSSLRPWLGCAAAGAAAVTVSLPGAMLTALGADFGGAGISMTAVLGLSLFLQSFPLARGLAPGAACALWMLVRQTWEPWCLLAAALGGGAAALLPWRVEPAHSGSLGIVQVRLEQTARVLTGFQRQLLEYAPPAVDLDGLTEQMQLAACASCPNREDCLERRHLDTAALTGDAPFLCRHPALAEAEVTRSRERLRRIRAARAAKESCRMALVQQYGFLADALSSLADWLAAGERSRPLFRVKVSARSRGRELGDGDRVSTFAGVGCRFYVLLCDGMGTGLGAAEQSRIASGMIRRMLSAGLPPEAVLGSINSQLTLTDQGGAVTVDLCELRLDTGRAWLYKWGAGRSWLLRRRRGIPIGSSGPPPGLGVSQGQENISRASLCRGETLVMTSDGVDTSHVPDWAAHSPTLDNGALAGYILQSSASQSDDATVITIRLTPKP